MSRSIAQIKDRLSRAYFPIMADAEPISLFDDDRQESFSLECLLRAISVEDSAGLLSRINCYFPRMRSLSAVEALDYAEVLNCVLAYSQVFVVQDIDGDRSYFLRMDTLLKGGCNRDNIANFLDNVTQDIDTMLKYFRAHSRFSNPEKCAQNSRPHTLCA